MQSLINVLALSSFAISAAIVGGGYYAFSNKEVIIENIKSGIIAEVTGGIVPDLPALGGADLPMDIPLGGDTSPTESALPVAPIPTPSLF